MFHIYRLCGRLTLLMALLFGGAFSVAAQFATPTIDGQISPSNEYGNTANNTNQTSSSSQTWYMTWDDNNLYVAIVNANVNEGAVLYVNPSPLFPRTGNNTYGGTNANGTTVGQNYDNTNFSQLPFRANYVTYFKNGYREFRRADGNGGWTSPTTNSGSYASSSSTNTRELSIPWNDITNGSGRPSAFLFMGYLTSSGGFVYGQVPQSNPSGNIGTSAVAPYSYKISNTSNGTSTPPFSTGLGPTASHTLVSGLVQTETDAPLAGVTIELQGAQIQYAVTDAEGRYAFDNLDANAIYIINATRRDLQFTPAAHWVALNRYETTANFTLMTRDPSLNPIDDWGFFVRQQYLDFLGREPDPSGFNFWRGELQRRLAACDSSPSCREAAYASVSAAFFFSPEFQQIGRFVLRLYRVADQRAPRFAEFLAAVQKLNQGWTPDPVMRRTRLDQKVAELLAAFVARYDDLNDEQYVDALLANASLTTESSIRAQLLAALRARTATRADVMQVIAQAELPPDSARDVLIRDFVLMQYFGYLRRDPDAPPDETGSGYNFWLEKLKSFDGDWQRAEMVKAFITAKEYRQRFGSPNMIR